MNTGRREKQQHFKQTFFPAAKKVKYVLKTCPIKHEILKSCTEKSSVTKCACLNGTWFALLPKQIQAFPTFTTYSHGAWMHSLQSSQTLKKALISQ